MLFFVRAVATGKIFCLAREVKLFIWLCLALRMFLLGSREFLVWLSPFSLGGGDR